jgi:hypothetical protein
MKASASKLNISENVKTISETLLSARKESLNRVQNTPLQARGKLWNMDVFSWLNPSTEELINTIDALPFQLIWMCKEETANQILQFDNSVLAKIRTIIQTNNAQFSLAEKHIDFLESYICFANTEESLEALHSFRKQKCAVIFSTNSESDVHEFEDFLKIHQ